MVAASGALAVGTLDGEVVVAPPGDVVRALPARGPVTALAWSDDGRRLAAAYAGGRAVVWDVAAGAELARHAVTADELPDGHATLAFAAADAVVLAARPDGASLVLDAATLAPRGGPLVGRVWPVRAAGAPVATADDGTITVDPAGRAPVALAGRRVAALAVAASPSGDRLAVAGADGGVEVWGVRGAARLAQLGGGGLGAATAVAFVDEDHVAVGHASGALRVYPVTPAAALAQACALAASFGGAAEVRDQCAGSSVTAIAETSSAER